MTPVETGEPHGSADQGSALGGSQEGGGNASAQRREEGRPGCEAIGRARCWKCWRGRQVGGTSPQGGWQSRHGAFEVTSAPARRSHRTGATHRGVPPRLTDLPLRHLSPPPSKHPWRQIANEPEHAQRPARPIAYRGSRSVPSLQNGRPRGCNRARLVLRRFDAEDRPPSPPGPRRPAHAIVALVSRGAAETAAWPRMRKRGGRVQPEPVRGLFVGG